MCGLVVDGTKPDQCSSCGVGDFRKLTEAERTNASKTATLMLEWEREAVEKLEQVPFGFMRTMTKCRIEHWARKCEHRRVTLKVVEAKYKSWEEGSGGQQKELDWTQDAVLRVEKVPAFIRPMIVKEIERNAQALGKHRVNPAVLDMIIANWGIH